MATGYGLRWYDNIRCNGQGYFAIDIIAKNEQTIIEWDGPPYIPNINMLDVYINGVFQQKTSYVELSGNSIECITQIPLAKDDIISIRYRPTGYNFGNIKVVTKANELTKIKDPIIGEVYLILHEKAFYIYNDKGEWEKLAQLIETRDEIEQRYLFEIDIEITEDNILTNIIEWLGPEYIMNINMLDVYLNGILLYRNDFNELSSNSIIYYGQTKLIKKDIITIKYRYTKVNLGNITVKESILGLNEIYMPVLGSCALIKNQKKVYFWNGNDWESLLDLGSGLIEIDTLETNTTRMKYHNDVISTDVKISEKIGNQLLTEEDGLYVSKASIKGYESVIVNNVKQNDIITIPKKEDEYSLDSLGVLKIYELLQDLNVTQVLNDYTTGNEDKYIYDADVVEFTPDGVSLKTEEIVQLEYIRDLEDGYKLYKVDIDLSKYKKILV